MEPRCLGGSESSDCGKNCSACDAGKNEERIAFKFRKNYFSKKEQEAAYAGLREAATKTFNRGLAAGPKGGDSDDRRDWVTAYQQKVMDLLINDGDNVEQTDNVSSLKKEDFTDVAGHRSSVWLTSKVAKDEFNFDHWLEDVLKIDKLGRGKEVDRMKKKYISDTTYATAVNSGIAGWFDRYPRMPYGRATAYTEYHFDKFKMSFPFLKTLNKGFKELLPHRWSKQKEAADKIDKGFLVPGTVFTTVTVNKTFRTAAHRDAGDLSSGLSNLLVLSNNGNYSGGYLIFPEYRIAVNVRPGDLLLVNNHEIIHGNTKIVPLDEEAERISLVCYFREKMLELGSKEYEDLRYQFVEQRRTDLSHPKQRKQWNGISEGMWESDEWFDFLDANGGNSMRKGVVYNADGKIERVDATRSSKLEDMFGE
jgi:hypothetical protein